MDNDGFTIPPKVYDFFKWVALVVLPAAAALVLSLGVLLNWSSATAVAGVITLVDTFLGAVLGKSASNYQAHNTLGDLVIHQDVEGLVDGMRVSGKVQDPVFKDGGKVILNVKREQQTQ